MSNLGPSSPAIGSGLPRLLFAYGTLVPREPTIRDAEDWLPDAIRGRLYDLGPYPGLVDLDDPAAPWVGGFVKPVDESVLTDHLDPYEGVDEGLYRREATTTRAGRPAWVYVYAGSLAGARGPIEAWRGES
jgi:gamma-glutamylcyclotransferase (GGCT)/AIG2-like uncharacterized protein YtfP